MALFQIAEKIAYPSGFVRVRVIIGRDDPVETVFLKFPHDPSTEEIDAEMIARLIAEEASSGPTDES